HALLALGLLGSLTRLSIFWVLAALSAVALWRLPALVLQGRREVSAWWTFQADGLEEPLSHGARLARALEGGGVCLVVASLAFLLDLCWAIAPEVQYDGLAYHLAVPKLYLQQGAIVNLPYFFHSYFARMFELLFLPCLAFGGTEAAAKLVVLGASVVGALAVFVLGRIVFDVQVGCWAAVLFFTTPVVSGLSGTTHVDLAIGLFLSATLVGCLRWSQSAAPGWLYLTALLAGSALAVKVNAAFGLVVPGFVVLAPLTARRELRPLLGGALAFLVVAAPWFLLIRGWTGNPVFPLYNGLFQSPLWDPTNRLMNAEDFGIGRSLGSLFRLPFSFTFDTTHFGEGEPRGAAGVALLLALPWLVLGFRKQSAGVRLLAATAVVYLALWAWTFQYVRYYVPILPAVCVLAAVSLRLLGPVAWVPIVCQIVVTPAWFWQIEDRVPLALALGRETRESFRHRSITGYAMAQRLNRVVPSNGRVLGVSAEGIRFHLDAPLETSSDSLLTSPVRTLSGMAPDRALAERIAQLGFTHILADRAVLAAPDRYYPYLTPAFLHDFAAEEACDAWACAYRMTGPHSP
ncbi:MAG: ArnT family glycosyltransferase, partial [bacterium]